MEDQVALGHCRAIHPRLVGFISLEVGDPYLAEDVAQETLARLLVRWGSSNQPTHPDAWAHRVALNLVRSYLRRKSAERRAHARHGARAAEIADAGGSAEAIAVRQALQELPRRQRTALILRYWGGFKVEEAAAVMRCRPGTVKALSHQGMTALRAHFGVEGSALSDVVSTGAADEADVRSER